jgi:hypothetical protein
MEYRCLVCGRVFASAQGLRGHLKAHKGSYKTVSFLASAKDYEEFKELCRLHGLTTCHLFNTFMFAMVEAFKRGGKVEWDPKTENLRASVGSNPIIVNLTQNFGAKPRGHGKYDVTYVTPGDSAVTQVLCLYANGINGNEIFCQKRGGLWLPVAFCSTCPKNRFQKKGEV